MDAILRGSDLRIPILWLLGSDVTEQEIVNRRIAKEGYRPDYAYALGVRALSGRDYPKAAELFGEAARLERGDIGALLCTRCAARGGPSRRRRSRAPARSRPNCAAGAGDGASRREARGRLQILAAAPRSIAARSSS